MLDLPKKPISTFNYIYKDKVEINNNIFEIKHNIRSIYRRYEYSAPGAEIINIDYYPGIVHADTANIFFVFEIQEHESYGHWSLESGFMMFYAKYFEDCKLFMNRNPKRAYKDQIGRAHV